MQPKRPFDIGIVTDEVSRNLGEALEIAEGWGLSRFELREGAERRFPFFTPAEAKLVDEALGRGGRVTAVSPGIFKGHPDDEARLRRELSDLLPRAIELAQRFSCPTMIVFGFERYPGEPASNRTRVLKAFEQAAERLAAAGLRMAIENEPNFWIDTAAPAAALLRELDHPAVGMNWDPANLAWGGNDPGREEFDLIRPFLLNVHVKDFDPADEQAPWRPVGRGTMPWEALLGWIVRESDLTHATLETHCLPLEPSSEESLAHLRSLLADLR